ncbi:MAG: PRD domain-containing protein [Lachnospiraceae bacterium]|nr:PRD domain-containing protein [Lachnospiraceae bacterium]
MIIEKVINNNTVSVLDGNNELILMGKGLGFGKKPGQEVYENSIEKKFKLDNANEVEKFKELIGTVSQECLEASIDIIEYGKSVMKGKISNGIYISLTDHLSFAITRVKQGIVFENPLYDEIQSYYPSEFLLGKYGLNIIKEQLGVELPKAEAASIALHFVLSEYDLGMSDTMNVTQLISKIVDIVNESLGINIEDMGLNYSRFITHLKFLSQRIFQNKLLDSQDDVFLEMIAARYPEEYNISKKICDYIEKKYEKKITKEEETYLAIYIRRLVMDKEENNA